MFNDRRRLECCLPIRLFDVNEFYINMAYNDHCTLTEQKIVLQTKLTKCALFRRAHKYVFPLIASISNAVFCEPWCQGRGYDAQQNHTCSNK